MKPIPTVGVLLFQDDSVLLVKHGEKAGHITGTYGIPAGRIEPGETTKQAAVRELFEETGLICNEGDLIELVFPIPDADIKRSDGTIKRFSVTLFLCKKWQGELASSEETTPEWIRRSEIQKLNRLINLDLMVQVGLEERTKMI